jgi:hypothetical protein
MAGNNGAGVVEAIPGLKICTTFLAKSAQGLSACLSSMFGELLSFLFSP